MSPSLVRDVILLARRFGSDVIVWQPIFSIMNFSEKNVDSLLYGPHPLSPKYLMIDPINFHYIGRSFNWSSLHKKVAS